MTAVPDTPHSTLYLMKPLTRIFTFLTLGALVALAPLAAWGQQQSSVWEKVHVSGAKQEGLQVYRHLKAGMVHAHLFKPLVADVAPAG